MSRPGSRWRAPVDIPPVGDPDDQDDEFVVPHFVHHAMIADAQPPQTPEVALQRRAEMRCLRQPIDGGDNPEPIRLGEALQLS